MAHSRRFRSDLMREAISKKRFFGSDAVKASSSSQSRASRCKSKRNAARGCRPSKFAMLCSRRFPFWGLCARAVETAATCVSFNRISGALSNSLSLSLGLSVQSLNTKAQSHLPTSKVQNMTSVQFVTGMWARRTTLSVSQNQVFAVTPDNAIPFTAHEHSRARRFQFQTSTLRT